MAVHLRHDADEWERLAVQSREMGDRQQALYCYGKLYSLNPSNINALSDRATLAKELLEIRTARYSFTAILKHYSHDMAVLAELRSILIDAGELALCASMYQRAFDHYQTAYPLGPPSGHPLVHTPVEHIAPEMFHGLGDSSSQNQSRAKPNCSVSLTSSSSQTYTTPSQNTRTPSKRYVVDVAGYRLCFAEVLGWL